MNISSVSTSSGSSYTPINSSDEVTQLEKQKTELEKELKEVNQSKEDAKTKQQKVQQLQNRILQIDAQIQQIKAEKSNMKQSTGQQAPAPDGNKNSVLSKNDADNLLEQVKKSMLGSQIDMQV